MEGDGLLQTSSSSPVLGWRKMALARARLSWHLGPANGMDTRPAFGLAINVALVLKGCTAGHHAFVVKKRLDCLSSSQGDQEPAICAKG